MLGHQCVGYHLPSNYISKVVNLHLLIFEALAEKDCQKKLFHARSKIQIDEIQNGGGYHYMI